MLRGSAACLNVDAQCLTQSRSQQSTWPPPTEFSKPLLKAIGDEAPVLPRLIAAIQVLRTLEKVDGMARQCRPTRSEHGRSHRPSAVIPSARRRTRPFIAVVPEKWKSRAMEWWPGDEMAVMKTRQFHRLAYEKPRRRWQMLSEGLELIAASIEALLAEIHQANSAGAYRAGRLACNVAREEAGKFLVLIDAARDPNLTQEGLSKQLARAGSHLEKLIYAQMADYSIASSIEMRGAIALHRDELHLDGPNDFDWVFPNELIAQRESAMYVDLVDSEDTLGWSAPIPPYSDQPERSTHLAIAIWRAGLTTLEGLSALGDAWDSFDHDTPTTATEWIARTSAAVKALPGSIRSDRDSEDFAAYWWPMPLTRLDVSMNRVKLADIRMRRQAELEAWMAREYGYPTYE